MRTLKLCNSQKCPQDSVDFRAAQCAEYNSKRFRGWHYKWKPYTQVEGKSQIPHPSLDFVICAFRDGVICSVMLRWTRYHSSVRAQQHTFF
jgi:hypothetical protein